MASKWSIRSSAPFSLTAAMHPASRVGNVLSERAEAGPNPAKACRP